MTFDEAVHVLRNPQPGAQGQIDYATAAATYNVHHDARRRRGTFTTDAMRTGDRQAMMASVKQDMVTVRRDLARISHDLAVQRATRMRDAGLKGTGSEIVPYEKGSHNLSGVVGAQEAAERIGGSVVGEFDIDASALIVLALGRGRAALVRIGKSDNVLDPGMVRDRVAREAKADASWSQRTLKAVNAANARFWGSAA